MDAARARERIQLKQSLAKLRSPFDGLGVTCRFHKAARKKQQSTKPANQRTYERSFIKFNRFHSIT